MGNAPGSATDTIGRIVSERLGIALGQPVVVDNRVGAGGTLAMELGKNAKPDGYTIIVASFGALTVSPHIRRNLPYDPVRDFEYVVQYARQGNVLVANPSLPVTSVKDFVEHARSGRGSLRMATQGVGSQSHLNGVALMMAGGFQSLQVPYKGNGPAVAAVISSESQWMFGSAGSMLGHARAGRLRGLGHTLPQRSALMGDMPAIAETFPGFRYVAFAGLLAPRGVPASILDRIRSSVERIVQGKEVQERFAAQGVEAATATPPQFRSAIQQELVATGRLIRTIGLTAE
ncbi:MAG: tripartite tricarboxylate transporter substrate binding protein [Burkholderiales bacterium]|nr:tripartite tricarboxylate transporter substrate binding protein [Burkholderiales bacterium]